MAVFSFISPCRIMKWTPNPSIDRSIKFCNLFLIPISLLLFDSRHHLRILITKQGKYLSIYIFCTQINFCRIFRTYRASFVFTFL